MNDNPNDLKAMLPDDALLRASGAPLIQGNRLRVLRDGRENYPEWEAAIRAAQNTIHLEMYTIHNDVTGRHFRDLLTDKAREGIRVRVLYDWFGARNTIWSGMWKPLMAAGGTVRVANPPRLAGLLGWIRRDHRKLLAVDSSVAFISGLCIGDAWVGNPSEGVQPWRDTGVMIHGPAVVDVENAFADAWRLAGGGEISDEETPRLDSAGSAGNVAVRIIAASPENAGLYRLDLLIAAAAQEYLWLTDAYFLGTSAYIQALRSAAKDGVDVRLLVPHGSDIQWIANVSRTSYRALLEAGVRVFEWNGPMMHAKTAVCDGLWARVGSSNLNLSSWLGNWELDVVIENEDFAQQIGEMFIQDLENATEVVLTVKNQVRPVHRPPRTPRGRILRSSGQGMILRAVTAGSALNAAVTGKRRLHRAESLSLFSIGIVFCLIALAAFFLPTVVAYTLAVMFGLIGAFLLARSIRLRFAKPEAEGEDDQS